MIRRTATTNGAEWAGGRSFFDVSLPVAKFQDRGQSTLKACVSTVRTRTQTTGTDHQTTRPPTARPHPRSDDPPTDQ